MREEGLRPYFLVAIVVIATTLLTEAQNYTFSILYSAKNSGTGPRRFNSPLIIDAAGNLYGTSGNGGDFKDGSVFKVTPTGTMSVLYSFKGATQLDGAAPSATPFMDSAGNLYGTTTLGGISGACPNSPLAQGCGTVFKVTSAGQETVLYRFQGLNDGSLPLAGVVVDSAGNVYGTTLNDYQVLDGGDGGNGDVYKIDTSGKFSIVHLFCSQDPNCPDGQYPASAPILDASGNLYGSTASGGAFSDGTIYQITPAGVETVLYNFHPQYTSQIQGDLTRDAQGNFYGVTVYNISNPADGGEIYKVTSAGQETLPYSFCQYPPTCPEGDEPQAPIQLDKAGNLFGVVGYGAVNGSGGVFKVTTSGTYTILYNFPSGFATNGLVIDSAGNLYGTSSNGGEYNMGTVYKLTLH
jgi:uncharacterized repeat protein (TIGR03803 family)